MTKRRLPFDKIGLGRKVYVLRLGLFETVTQDISRPWEPDEGLWLFEGAMDDRMVVPYEEVWDYCAAYSELPAMVMVMWGLWHPDSPFGLGFKIGQDGDMLVMWNGMFYIRDRRGVLITTGQPVYAHPTRTEWFDALAEVRDHKPKGARD